MSFQKEKVSFETLDGVKIVGDFYEVKEPLGWALLLHMMPATRDSYSELAQKLAENSFASLAIDLRGHGESSFGPDGYLSFKDTDHQKSIFDISSAVDFLLERGASKEKIFFVGASIGANLAVLSLVKDSGLKAGVLLSPGLNYRGIVAKELVSQLKEDQSLFIVGTEDDIRASGEANSLACKELFEIPINLKNKELKIFTTGGHGTDILKNQPEVMEKIIDWVGFVI